MALISPAFFVSPTGSDGAAGTQAAPFLTLTKARDAMRASGTTKTTYLRGGTYFISAQIDLTSSDNNTVWLGFPAETARISGGTRITGFTNEGAGLYTKTLAANPGVDISIGGVRQYPAQSGVVDLTDRHRTGWLWSSGGTGTTLVWKVGDLTSADVKVGMVLMAFLASSHWPANGWANSTNVVTAVNTTTRTLTVSGFANGMGADGMYRLMNNSTLIRNFGEFGWRFTDSKIVLKPLNPATFDADGVVIAQIGTIFNLTGCTNVDFRDLTFSDTLFNLYSTGATINATSCTNLRIGGCIFTCIGAAAEFQSGCTACTIAGCTMNSVGSYAIYVDLDSNNHFIYGNSINGVGIIDAQGAGITVSGGNGTRIAYNTITDCAGAGIAVTNVVGGDSSHLLNNVVDHNKIVGACTETSDAGGIVMWNAVLMNDTNTKIVSNWVQNCTGLNGSNGVLDPLYWCLAIYLDDDTSGVQITGNFFLNAGDPTVLVHGGQNVAINNNIAVVNNINQTVFASHGYASNVASELLNVTYSHNILYSTTSRTDYMANNSSVDFTSNNNVLFNFAKFSGKDASSVIADPLFVDPATLWYHLSPSSPAFGVGATDLDWGMGQTAYTSGTGLPLFWTSTMTDLVRNKSFLTTALADNVSNAIVPQNIRDMLLTLYQFAGNPQINLGTVANTTYVLDAFATDGYLITGAYLQAASGTCTAAIKIAGSTVTGLSAVAVSTTLASPTATAANTVAAGQQVSITISANSAATGVICKLLRSPT